MQSSANTALVGLIVIVSALLLSAALLVLGGSGIDFFAGKKYFVLARFDDVTGIDRGMAVTANGRQVGLVDKVIERDGRITAGPIDVKLRIDERVALRREARAIVTQPEFLGDQVLVLDGLAGPGEPAEVKEGDVIEGVNGGSLMQLASETVRETADELTQKLDLIMAQALITMQAVNGLLGGMTDMIDANKDALQGTMSNLQAASGGMIAVTSSLARATEAVAQLTSDPQQQANLRGISENLYAATSDFKAITANFNALSSDQTVAADLKGTIAGLRQTTESLNESLTALQPTMGKVNTLLDESAGTMKAVGDVARGVGGIIGTGESDAVSGAKSKVQSGIEGVTSNIHLRLDMDTKLLDSDDSLSYSGDDLRTRDINATLGYGEVFAQFGADNIGLDDGGVNFLLGTGDPNKGFSYKTGVIRSEVGTGVSYRLNKNAGIDASMYDSNDPKYNAQIKVPVGRSFSAIVGMEDITGESQAMVGLGVAY